MRVAGSSLRRAATASRYDGPVTNDAPEPGDRRPTLDRPPGERYAKRATAVAADADVEALDRIAWPVAVGLGTVIAFTILGGLLTVTAGLIVVAGFAGWLLGKLVSPPPRAALVAVVAIVLGFLGIWLYGRFEGGVLAPLDYLAEVEGPIVVVLTLLAGGGMAAAASR